MMSFLKMVLKNFKEKKILHPENLHSESNFSPMFEQTFFFHGTSNPSWYAYPLRDLGGVVIINVNIIVHIVAR